MRAVNLLTVPIISVTLGVNTPASVSALKVVFEQAGSVHELDAKTGRARVVNITATGDFPLPLPCSM